MKNVSIYLLFFCSITLYAQGENDNWYFGHGAGLNFATNPPTALTDGQTATYEGVASISDSDGNLLFYSDGINVWDSSHSLMPNGTGLTGSNWTIQSALIVPHPGNTDQYYLFTVPQYANSMPTIVLSYSVIDMSLNNGMGDVVSSQKNIAVLNEIGNSFVRNSYAITYTANSTNDGYWVVFPKDNTLYSYPINSSGFVNNPTTSSISVGDGADRVAHIRISPDNSKVAISRIDITSGEQPLLKVYNFDNATGQAGTELGTGCTNCLIYATEFSPDSNVLYASEVTMYPAEINYGTIRVYDLINNQTRTMTQANVRYGTIQRSKYNDIYIAQGDYNAITGYNYVSTINNPNDYATSSINPNSIYLNGEICNLGLPQWVHILPQPDCPANLTLSTTETNTIFEYQYSNSITTNTNYIINNGSNITFKAGNFIQLDANTHIKENSLFLAEIEECPVVVSNAAQLGKAPTSVKRITEYTADDQIQVYPNPISVGNVLNIFSNSDKPKVVAIYDITGKQVLSATTAESTVNTGNLTAGVYIVKITEEGKTATKKLIVQ